MSKKEIIEKEGVRYEVIRVLEEEKKVIVEGLGDVSEYECWYNEKYCLRAVKEDGDALRYVKEQTPELCLEAVKDNGDALRYVNKKVLKKKED